MHDCSTQESPSSSVQWQHCPFVIDGSSIDFVDSFTHLGHIISSVSGDNEDISHRRCKFIRQTNSVLCDFWNLGSDGKYRLFNFFLQ